MRLLLVILLLSISFIVSGQNKQLLYNFNDLPQNLMSNPGAETNFDMHIGMPFLSQLHFSAGSSGLSAYDLFRNDGGSINTRIRRVLKSITNKDFFTVHEEMEIFYVGWRDQKRRYYSAGVYQELDAFLYFPKDPAVLVYEGNRDHVGRNFHFSDLAFTAEVLNVFHLGLTNYYSKDLNYGVRGKLYSGVLNVQSVGNEGVFRTSAAAGGSYTHVMRGVDVVVNTSGLSSLVDSTVDSTGIQKIRSVAEKAFLGGNLGLGLDIGFTWYPREQYRVTGSISDIGFLQHETDVESYRYYGDYEARGVDFVFPRTDESAGTGKELSGLDGNFKEEVLDNSYISWRPVKLNASVDFGFEEDPEPCNCQKPSGRRRYLNHLGFHLFSMVRPRGLVSAATVSFDRRFSERFRGKMTYTVDSFSFHNAGLLFSGRFRDLNIYLAADNLFSYTNLAKAQNVSLQLGLQFIFNRD